MATFDERLAKLSGRLAELSEKAAKASENVQAARELKEEAVQNQIETVRGNFAALEENLRIADEQQKGKIRSALLKAKMTVEARVQDRRDARDKRHLERYIDMRLIHALDCYDSASYLIADAELTMLEVIDAAKEYEARFGTEPELEEAADAEA